MNHKEQYALALAISGYKTQKMTENEHVFGWSDKPNTEGVVYHYINHLPRTFWEHLITSLDRNIPVNISQFKEVFK